MKKTTVSMIVLTLSTLYAITPLLLRPEFAFGEDIHHHINWASQVSLGFREGILYPRWMALSNAGYGSPTFVFYSPLFYWVTGVVNLFIGSIVVSLKIATFISFLLTGISMYIYLRNYCGYAASVAGGMMYQLTPYHLLDMYDIGRLAETVAFAWLPLILHFAYKGFKEDNFNNWLRFAFSYAGLILTHLVSAYMFTFVIAAFALFLSIEKRDFRLLMKPITASIFGLSLAAVYFMPMFFERKYVHIESLTAGKWGDYKQNFLFMKENIGSALYMNLELIIILQLLLVITTLIPYCRSQKLHKQYDSTFTFLLCLFAFSFFISIPISIPIWKIIPGFQTIQVPWRWLMVSSFATAALVGFSFDSLSFDAVKKDRMFRVFIALFHAFFLSNLYLSFSYLMMASPVDEKDLQWILKDGGDVIEYRPVWLTQKTKDFSREKGKPPVIFKEGMGEVRIVRWQSHCRLFTVDASLPSVVRVSTFYYPGWTASINDKEIPIGIERDSGAMLLNSPPGKNTVLLEFRDTPLRKAAKWVSIISLFAALTCLIVPRFKRPL